MKKLTFALIALLAIATALVPDVALAVQGAINHIGPDVLMGVGMAGTVAATVTKSDTYTGKYPLRIIPTSSEVADIAVPITFPSAAPIANDTHALCTIPAGKQVVDWTLILADHDDGATSSLELGTLNAGLTDIDTSWKTGITIGQAGGLLRNADGAAWAQATTSDRVVGLKWSTAAAVYLASKTGLLILHVVG